MKYYRKSQDNWENGKYLSWAGNRIVSGVSLLNLIQTGIGTTGAQQLYKFTPGEVQYGKVEDILSRRARAQENAKGLIDNSISAIASAAIPNKIGGGKITIPETAQVVVGAGEAVGVAGKVITLPALGTGGVKAAFIVSGVGNGSNNSEKNDKNITEKSDSKKEDIKSYYETKSGNPKAKKYLEKGETLEQHYEKYAIENVKNKGINVGRSKEHSNTTVGHWEKMVDIAEEAKAAPNVKAVYLDETLTNVSFEQFGKETKRPDIIIEYNDETFKIIEVQSLTDDRVKLENKLRNLQTKYGKDVIKDFEVVKPKGGK